MDLKEKIGNFDTITYVGIDWKNPNLAKSNIHVEEEYWRRTRIMSNLKYRSVDNQILCDGELTDPIQFTTLNTDGVSEYNWTNTNTSIGLASAGTLSLIHISEPTRPY
mgnify:CR=1 FL=1